VIDLIKIKVIDFGPNSLPQWIFQIHITCAKINSKLLLLLTSCFLTPLLPRLLRAVYYSVSDCT